MNTSLLLALKPLVQKCLAFSPMRVLSGLLLMLLSSVTSGVGILLIIPLLASVGVDLGGATSNNGISDTINELAANIGLELNLLTVLIIYLVIIFVLAAFSFVSSIVLVSLRQSFVMHLRDDISRALFFTQWRYLNRQHMADFMRLLTGQVNSVGACLSMLLTLASSLVLVVVYLSFALLLSAKLTLLALIFGLGLAALLWPVNKRIHASGSLGLKASTNIHRSIFENISSLKIIKSFAAEERYLEHMRDANRTVEEQQIRMAKYNALTRFVNMVGAAVIFTLLFYSSIEWLSLPTANLLVMLFIFSRLMPQISSIQSTIQALIHRAPAYQDLLEQSANLVQWTERLNDEVESPQLKREMQLNALSYQYLDGETYAFENVNATIKYKQTVAIVGPSGVGKSTLADLISGLIEPTSGSILIDGAPITDESRLSWRKQVAYVTQDVFLFHDSVRENLSWVCDRSAYPQGKIPEDELWQALTLAAADEFVKRLPLGLDTLIGDRGVKLSGGERQRLALARALLSKPQVLILDEATSALDRENELKIRDALVRLDGRLTIFIIAHNETTIEHVSQRIEMTPQ
jgi:ATP-binding cassette subfamily C protein